MISVFKAKILKDRKLFNQRAVGGEQGQADRF